MSRDGAKLCLPTGECSVVGRATGNIGKTMPQDPSDERQAPADASESPGVGSMLQRGGVDRAVVFAVLLRGWQFIGGSISSLLIALIFTKNQQGFYYVFGNLLAIQAFFELGLNIVVVNVASHEWSKLRMSAEGAIEGDPDARSRLISLGQLIFRWYAVAAVGFILVAGVLGLWFFSRRPDQTVVWREPWCWLAVSTGLLLWTLPFNALLEGCNRVASVNRFRLVQAIIGNLVVWTVLFAGGGLWAVAASSWARLLCELAFLLVGYRRFFAPFFQRPSGPRISWRSEIWPMQWRLAIAGVVGYFALNLFAPVMFDYHGAAVAGRMGMTWTLLSVLQAAALAWVHTRTPAMGRLVAERRYAELNELFTRLSKISWMLMALGGAAFWIGLHVLAAVWPALAGRLLDPTSAGLLTLGFLLAHFPHCQAFYIRAHKIDNLLGVSVLSSILIAASVWWLGAWYGPIGAASGYLAVCGLVILPLQTLMWLQCRRDQQT